MEWLIALVGIAFAASAAVLCLGAGIAAWRSRRARPRALTDTSPQPHD